MWPASDWSCLLLADFMLLVFLKKFKQHSKSPYGAFINAFESILIFFNKKLKYTSATSPDEKRSHSLIRPGMKVTVKVMFGVTWATLYTSPFLVMIRSGWKEALPSIFDGSTSIRKTSKSQHMLGKYRY